MSGSTTIHCDLAVVLAKSGNKAGAAEVLRNIMKHTVESINPDHWEDPMRGLAKAVMRISDKELCREFIDWASKLAKGRSVFGPVVLVQCHLEDFAGARENLPKAPFMGREFNTYVETLIKLKKYDILESYLREVEKDGRYRVPAWCAIARAKHKDGDKAGAVEAIKAAIHSAKNDPNGYTYGEPVMLIDIALDIKYSMSEQPGRAPMESVNEVIRWHRTAMERKSTDAADYSEEELRHLIRGFSESLYRSGAIQTKLREMGSSIYPLIFDMIRESLTDRGVAGNLFALIDISKADSKELRALVLLIREKHASYKRCYEILGEVGLPEDVPGLLVWKEHVHEVVVPAFQAVAKIASPEQLPEIEKAAKEVERIYFEQYKDVDAKFHEYMTSRWHEEVKPEIDKALQTIRERREELKH
jgi:hypothetical protein